MRSTTTRLLARFSSKEKAETAALAARVFSDTRVVEAAGKWELWVEPHVGISSRAWVSEDSKSAL